LVFFISNRLDNFAKNYQIIVVFPTVLTPLALETHPFGAGCLNRNILDTGVLRWARQTAGLYCGFVTKQTARDVPFKNVFLIVVGPNYILV